MTTHTTHAAGMSTDKRNLYTIGGAAALFCALMYVIALAVYVPANSAGPAPASVLEWFTVFQDNALTGLFFLGFADIVIMIAWVPMILALYGALRRRDSAWAAVAVPLVMVGVAVYLATNTAFSMLTLSNQYAAATNDAEKASILAAGQTLIAISQGTGGQYLGMPLAWLGGLIVSLVMLRSDDFSRLTAWVGILGLGLLLASVPFAGYTTAGEPTAAVSAIVAVTYVGGGLLSLAWYILIGLRLLKLRTHAG